DPVGWAAQAWIPWSEASATPIGSSNLLARIWCGAASSFGSELCASAGEVGGELRPVVQEFDECLECQRHLPAARIIDVVTRKMHRPVIEYRNQAACRNQ